MQWLSDTCVLLDNESLINASYCQYKAAPGQFNLEKPYQAGPQHSSTLTACDTSSPSPVRPCMQDTTEAIHEQCHTEPDNQEVPTGLAGDAKHSRKRKRVQIDPQRSLRQQEANDRHDGRQPTLLSAHILLQHFISSGNAVMQCRSAHIMPRDDSPPSSCSHDNSEQLDLCALHKLKYTLHPKFQFDDALSPEHQDSASNLFDAVHSNIHESERLATAYQSQVLIPPHATFLISDVKRLQPLLSGTATTVACLPW